jgi:nitroreductase
VCVEATQAIRKRKCVKKFLDKEVPPEVLYEVLDCARWAQTALGAQSWDFVVVRDTGTKAKLSVAAEQEWVEAAPVVVVVCSNLERIAFTLKKESRELSIMEVSAAVQNMQVAARSLDLGTCAVFMFDRATVQKIIKAPDKVLPVAMVPMGYPKEFPENSRGPLKDFVHGGEFGRPPADEVPDEYNRKWQRDSLIHLLS